MQWYQELNQLLAGRAVIHLQCFNSTSRYFDQLQGLRFTAALTELSVAEPGADRGLFMADPRRNHFSAENNCQLADFVAQHYVSNGAANRSIDQPFTDHK
jgi:hypothetical protein